MASVSNFTGGLEAHHGGAETKITKDVPGDTVRACSCMRRRAFGLI